MMLLLLSSLSNYNSMLYKRIMLLLQCMFVLLCSSITLVFDVRIAIGYACSLILLILILNLSFVQYPALLMVPVCA